MLVSYYVFKVNVFKVKTWKVNWKGFGNIWVYWFPLNPYITKTFPINFPSFTFCLKTSFQDNCKVLDVNLAADLHPIFSYEK